MGLDTAELLHKIDIHFAIRIPNEEAAKAYTVQDVYQMVLRNLTGVVDQQQVYDAVVQLIAKQTGLEGSQIEPQHSLTDDLGMD